MKILFLFPHFLLPGGAANVTVKFARGLQENGHIVEILCANAVADFLVENSDLKISQLRIPNSDSFFYWALLPYWQFRINKALKEYGDYIFFPQVFPSNWWTWIYKLFNKEKKVVWYCNEPSAFIHSEKWIQAIKNPLMRIGARIVNPLLKYADISLEKQNNLVICNSQFTAIEYERCYDGKADEVIYPPLKIENAKILLDREKYFLSVGRLSKFKNVDILINALEEIYKIFPDHTLIIVGDGEERKNLENATIKKNLTARVNFLGKVSDEVLAELYKRARATVLCSENEPFGIVPVESMMHGTPVIAHNSGGPKETIINNETGFLFEDKNNLIACMKKIIEMEEVTYLKMQENCQKEAARYDLSNSIEKLVNILINK